MTTQSDSDSARTMYVQMAGRAMFDGSSLTLLDLAPATVFLAEQPDGPVGYLPTGLFLDRWYAEEGGTGTRSVPAVLSFLDPDRRSSCDARLMLSLPRIREAGVEYQVRIVVGEVPSRAGACVLFISPSVTPSTPGQVEGTAVRIGPSPTAA